jgi:GMP synthase (glutamine-hydrolysing)
MEQEGIPDVDPSDYAAVIVGGGPANVSDPEDKKDDRQKRFERHLHTLFDQIVELDHPYLGACYGLGALFDHQGAKVSMERYSEPVGGVIITLTEEGEKDPLLEGLPRTFRALCGHKEACQNLPEGAVLLASSESCPIQIARLKSNLYGIQFHPELDVPGICVRIDVYKHAGYFPPEDAEKLKQKVCDDGEVIVPMEIMRRFVERYRR